MSLYNKPRFTFRNVSLPNSFMWLFGLTKYILRKCKGKMRLFNSLRISLSRNAVRRHERKVWLFGQLMHILSRHDRKVWLFRQLMSISSRWDRNLWLFGQSTDILNRCERKVWLLGQLINIFSKCDRKLWQF